MNGSITAANRRGPLAAMLITLLAPLMSGCVSTTDELLGVAALPPLDRAVLVSGGAFSVGNPSERGTFRLPAGSSVEAGRPQGEEPIAFSAVVDVLQRGSVFQRVAADTDPARRRRLLSQLQSGSLPQEAVDFLRQAREDGFDLLLLIEELQDGPIESQGTNGRWPVTFATWILLGVGAFIPDRTFESRSALRVSFRELQTGEEVDSILLVPGPIDLSLTERSDLIGFMMSIVVPPFWVGDDEEVVNRSVRDTSERRLLVSLARELKSDIRRRRLGEREVAAISLQDLRSGPTIVVEAEEALSVAKLVGGVDDDVGEEFVRQLMASRQLQGGRSRYEALVPPSLRGRFQLRVGTLRGGVSSSTFRLEERR